MDHTVLSPVAEHPLDRFVGKPCLICADGVYYVLARPLADGAGGWGPCEKFGLVESNSDGLLRCGKCGDVQRFRSPGETLAEGTSATTGIAWSG